MMKRRIYYVTTRSGDGQPRSTLPVTGVCICIPFHILISDLHFQAVFLHAEVIDLNPLAINTILATGRGIKEKTNVISTLNNHDREPDPDNNQWDIPHIYFQGIHHQICAQSHTKTKHPALSSDVQRSQCIETEDLRSNHNRWSRSLALRASKALAAIKHQLRFRVNYNELN